MNFAKAMLNKRHHLSVIARRAKIDEAIAFKNFKML